MKNIEYAKQDEIVNEVVDACIKSDLNKVKDLITKVSFDPPYNGYVEAKSIFLAACQSNDLNLVKFLIDTKHSGDNMNNSAIVDSGLKIAVDAKDRNYDLIRYLAREPKLSKVLYSDYPVNRLVKSAILEENITFLDSVLDLKDTSKYNVFIWPKEFITQEGCKEDKTVVIKHFFTNPELANVLDSTATFKESCLNNNHKLLSFFVFDLKINKTEDIANYIEEGKYTEVDKMFNLRDFNDSLTKELDEPNSNDLANKKMKM